MLKNSNITFKGAGDGVRRSGTLYLFGEDRSNNCRAAKRRGELYKKSYTSPKHVTLFWNWILKNKPDINFWELTQSSEIDTLIKEYHNTSKKKVTLKYLRKCIYSSTNLSDIENRNFWNKLYKKSFKGKEYRIELLRKAFKRYETVKYHAFMLFPKANKKQLVKFYKKYFDDINVLSGDTIDIYFDLEDMKYRSGHYILGHIDIVKSEYSILPCILLWDKMKGIEYSVWINLSDLNNKDIYTIFQILANELKNENINLADIEFKLNEKVDEMILNNLDAKRKSNITNRINIIGNQNSVVQHSKI